MLHRHAGPAVAGSYATGAITGALAMGGVFVVLNGLLSPIPPSVRGAVAICGLLLLVLHAANILCLDLPQRRYQIPRETFSRRPTLAAFRFAFELGTGVRTYITAVSPYALALIMALCLPSGLVDAGVAAGGAALGYGVGRSVIVTIQSLRSSIAVDHPVMWLRRADNVALVTALASAISFV